MKRAAVLAVVMLFSASVISAFAGGATESDHKPLSKHPDKSIFQSVSDDIAKCDDLAANAKASSLRDNKEELARRRGIKIKK